MEFWLVPVPVDLASTRPVQHFFHVVFRFYDELPASRAPSRSLAGSRAPLQFPDCITCYPPVPRLHHVLSSSSLAVSHAPLQFPDCITCYPRVHKMYHAPTPPPPLATLGEENYLYFHRLLILLMRHFRIIILLDKFICHKFYTLT